MARFQQRNIVLNSPYRLALSYIARWIGVLDDAIIHNNDCSVMFHDPTMRLNTLVRFLGGCPERSTYGQQKDISAWHSIIGAATLDDAHQTIADAEQWALAQVSKKKKEIAISLTFDGWQKYRALMHNEESGKKAVVMSTASSPELTMLIRTCICPLLQQQGYNVGIEVVDDNTLDLGLMEKLRGVSLMIADISDKSDRMPWHAAVARAMGKPVIHTRSIDSSGHQCDSDIGLRVTPTVTWDLRERLETKLRLAATIREVSAQSRSL